MDYKKYILPAIVLLTVVFLFDNFKQYTEDDEEAFHYKMVEKYLLTESSLARSKKPLLWIHSDYDTNSRWWASWGSRNSECLNQPYKFLAIKSLIDKCGQDFNVLLIDDDSFMKLIPGWNINLNKVGEPVKGKIRRLALARILKYYGGIIVPSSFVCFLSLKDIYNGGIKNTGMFVGEAEPRNGKGPPRSRPDQNIAAPTSYFMGCKKKCPLMSEYINLLEKLIATDYTAESLFLGEESKWFADKIQSQQISVIGGELLGCRDTKNNLITIEQLMGNSYIDIEPTAVGVYLPDEDILRRTKYQWFARLSARQAVESDTMAGKILMLAN
jgi:hypothetical protein